MSEIGITSLIRTFSACEDWLSARREWDQTSKNDTSRSLFCDGACLAENTNSNSPNGDLKGRWFGYTLASIIVLFSLGLLAWTIRYRRSRVVRASQPIFLILILSGTIVFGSSLFPLGVSGCDADDSSPCDAACMAAPWLSILGWTMLFSGIYSKLRRVRIVVQSAQQFRRVTIGYMDVLKPFLILFVLNFIALLSSTILFPLQWEIIDQEPGDKNTTSSSTYGTCTFKDGTVQDTIGSLVFALLTLGNLLALVLAFVEAYRGRNIIVEYNESRYILMAAVCIFQTVLVGFPILILVDEQRNKTLNYFINSTLTFTVCMSILLFLFVPKIVAQHKNGPVRQGSPTSMTTGLSIRKRLGTSSILQAQLNSFKAKIDQLESLLNADGIDASVYFSRVGLRSTVPAITSPETVTAASTSLFHVSTTITPEQESSETSENHGTKQQIEQKLQPQQIFSTLQVDDDDIEDDFFGDYDSNISNEE